MANEELNGHRNRHNTMGFWSQLETLLWKNFLLRWRAKVGTILLVITPFLIGGFFVWIRSEAEIFWRPECHYSEKAMPSAGQMPFLHSFLCNAPNICHEKLKNSNGTDVLDSVELNAKNTREKHLFRLLRNLFEAVVILNDASEKQNFPYVTENTVQLWDFIPEAKFLISNQSNLQARQDLNSLLKAEIILKPEEDMSALTEDPYAYYCESRKAYEKICSAPKNTWAILKEEFTRINASSFASSYDSNNLKQYLPYKQWLRINRLLKEVTSDIYVIQGANSVNLTYSEMLQEFLATVGTRNSTLNICDTYRFANQSSGQDDETMWNKMSTYLNGKTDLRLKYKDVNEPQECVEIQNTVTSQLPSVLFWNMFKPFIRGKILYTPDTPVTRRIMEKVNQTYNDLFKEPELLTKPDIFTQDYFEELIQTDASQEILSASLLISPEATRLLQDNETVQALIKFGDSETQMTSANLERFRGISDNFFKCLDRQKVVPFDTFEKAVHNAIELSKTNTFWALIIFDKVGQDTITPSVKYRIGMNFDRTETSRDARREIMLRPRDNPFIDLKYLTYGFAYLQDMVDTAIISEQTGISTEELPGRYLQQYPIPSVKVDRLSRIMDRTFSMFIVMSLLSFYIINIRFIIFEKQQRIKEMMGVFGVSNSVQWASRIVESSALMILPLLAMAVIFHYGNITSQANISVVLAFLLLAFFAILSQSFLMSTLFSRAAIGTVVGACLYMVPFFAFVPMRKSVESGQAPAELVTALCLMSNYATALGATIFIWKEMNEKETNWTNLFDHASLETDFSLGAVMCMLIVDTIIHGLLTWYIEAVWPGEYGVPKGKLFFLDRSYWTGRKSSRRSEDKEMEMGTTHRSASISNDDVETEPKDHYRSVSLVELTKVFNKTKVSVDKLTLNFFQHQITSFLGHNGAGKTTTISMLIGMYTPTSGTAFINGHDIRYDMDLIRKDLGLCPQYDILYPKLTVTEHLKFYGRVKGLEKSRLGEEIQDLLKTMQMSEWANKAAEDLSGGMRRRLCLAIAFMGRSSIVILDEPTAGVDPYSRRSIWDVLLKMRKDRTLILTTHFMDEADILGDRIAIISKGKLKCVGSSLYLKSRFGEGYYLTLSFKTVPPDKTQTSAEMEGFCKRHVPEASVLQNVGKEVVISLPNREDINAITQLIAAFEANKQHFGIESFGISDTPLEDIFLKMTIEPEQDHLSNGLLAKATTNGATNIVTDGSGSGGGGASNSDDVTPQLQLPAFSGRLLVTQIKALFYKRFHHVRRDLKFLVISIAGPLTVIILGLIVTKFVGSPLDDSAKDMYSLDTGEMLTSPYTFVQDQSASPGIAEVYLQTLRKYGLRPPDYHSTRSRWFKVAECDPSEKTYKIPSGERVYNKTGESIPEWLLRTTENCQRDRLGGISVGAQPEITNVWDENDPLLKSDNIRVWYDNKLIRSSVSYLNSASNVILRALLPEDKRKEAAKFGISVSNHPLSLTESNEDQRIKMIGEVLSVVNTVLFAMSILTATTAFFLVEDRVSNMKHLQLVSGMNRYIYWIQTFLCDLLFYLVPAFLTVIVCLSFGNEILTSAENIFSFILILLFFGWSCIPLVYCISKIFDEPNIAFVCSMVIVFMSGSLVLVMRLLIEANDNESALDTSAKVFLIFPQYCLSQGIRHMAEATFRKQTLLENGIIMDYNALSWDVTGQFLFGMFFSGIFFLSLAIFFDVCTGFENLKLFIAKRRKKYRKQLGPSPQEEDNDVRLEEERIQTGRAVDDLLVFYKLTKIYKNPQKPAVNRVSLGVAKGQCFGLLGLNGAGKTTTFKMLTGEIPISGGDAFVMGRSVRKHISTIRQMMGYCPQFDSLNRLLTVYEHLMFFAKLRGFSKQQQKQAVDEVMDELRLRQFSSVGAGKLSGGNRRKLSTAIALLGNPPLIYMDEPTTGMDPGARRFLWNCILQRVSRGHTVVFTSHSMEECEKLCTVATILVKGRPVCLGSVQHLKNKYSKGHTLTVSCPKGADADVARHTAAIQSLVSDAMPGSTLIATHVHRLIFRVPHDTNLSTIFETVKTATADGIVVDYSVSQTTLEDVFMRFAGAQDNSE